MRGKYGLGDRAVKGLRMSLVGYGGLAVLGALLLGRDGVVGVTLFGRRGDLEKNEEIFV